MPTDSGSIRNSESMTSEVERNTPFYQPCGQEICEHRIEQKNCAVMNTRIQRKPSHGNLGRSAGFQVFADAAVYGTRLDAARLKLGSFIPHGYLVSALQQFCQILRMLLAFDYRSLACTQQDFFLSGS